MGVGAVGANLASWPVLGAGQGGPLAHPPSLHPPGQGFVLLPMPVAGGLPGMPLGAPWQVPHSQGFWPLLLWRPCWCARFIRFPPLLASGCSDGARVVNPVPLSGGSGEGAGMLEGVGGGPQVSSAFGSSGGVAGLVGVVGGVTSDVLGVGSSWPGPGAGSGECDHDGGGVGVVVGGLVCGSCVCPGFLGSSLA